MQAELKPNRSQDKLNIYAVQLFGIRISRTKSITQRNVYLSRCITFVKSYKANKKILYGKENILKLYEKLISQFTQITNI